MEVAMKTLIVVLVVLACVVVFSVQNGKPVTVTFLFWTFEASLALVILTSVVAGALMAFIAAVGRSIKKPGKGGVTSKEGTT
jgi:uncharacterized integral membrane protein